MFKKDPAYPKLLKVSYVISKEIYGVIVSTKNLKNDRFL